MQSTPDTRNDPHDVLEIAPDVVLVARAAADFPSLSPAPMSQPYDRQPNMDSAYSAAYAPEVDTTFRASDVNEGVRPRGRWIKTVSVAFLLALGSAFATAAWERYGDQAQAMVADFTPRNIVPDLSSWLPLQRDAAAAQPNTDVPQAAATDQAETPTAPPTQSTDSAAPAPAALPQDAAQTLQTMSRDVASLTQQIGELKASIAQLKATQEQLTRDMASRVAEAKPAEPKLAEPRSKQLGAPPRPLGTLVQHKPKPVIYAPAQATAAPLPSPSAAPPVQLTPAQPDGDPVVRPPMPVR
jgi:hypothetical protein